MAIDEGYIKYDSRWTPGPPPESDAVADLDRWRSRLFDAGLVGHYADLGVGYGNLSVRAVEPGQFIITGTQTGHLETTGRDDYALVTRTAIADNTVWSTGTVQASSEAMTHAALYALSPAIGAVVHVHSKQLWDRLLQTLPTTSADVPYGTPAMAREFSRLWEEGRFAADGIAVMAGHEEGIVSIGADLREAAERVLALTAPGEGS
jgi:ribulose-5-phosphate 4-epimerase/fuculose-1-phosphate aldolase